MSGKITNEISAQGIMDICSSNINPDEQKMLDAVQAIDSLTNSHESLALYRLCTLLPEGARVLEIGSFNGASAAAMGYALKGKKASIYCIDPWSNYMEQDDFSCTEPERINDDKKIMDSFIKNTAFLGSQVKMMRGLSADFAGMIVGQNFDLIFIDGAHDYDSVRFDILACMAALKPGGLLTGHDYHSLGHGVRKTVNELISIVPSITIKGVIKETYIWFAKVEQPAYEIALTAIADLYSAGDVPGALNQAFSAVKVFKTEELLMLIADLKSKMANGC